MFDYIRPSSSNYPARLKNALTYAPILTVIGNDSHIKAPSLAVIGCEFISPYGLCVLNSFLPNLGLSGLTLVTETSRGISDNVIHLAITYNLPVICVLSMGLLHISSSEDYLLIKKVASYSKGCVISPFDTGAKFDPKLCNAMYTVLAGLSLAVLIVESYNLYQTSYVVTECLDMGKPVYCVPGDIFSKSSQGTNQLIRSGAILVSSPEDILVDLKF